MLYIFFLVGVVPLLLFVGVVSLLFLCWSCAFVIFAGVVSVFAFVLGVVFLLLPEWHFCCSVVLCFVFMWWESWSCAPPLDHVYPFGDRFFIGMSSSGFLYVSG